jgi:succinate dehydrogenase/fumarate reductase flavoprotein subunit
MVFGAVAGRNAARSLGSGGERDWSRIFDAALDAARSLGSSPSGPAVDEVKTEIRQVMSACAGIYRSEAGLARGAAALRDIAATVRRGLSFAGEHDWIGAREAGNMALAGRCVIAAALARRESRGAHQRRDHPALDDQNFLVHLAIRAEADGEIAISIEPIQ